MSGKGFFSRILGGGGDDETSVFSPEALGRKESRRGRGGPPPPEEEQRAQGFTVERAAEIIDDLPPEVPRDSAVRIVRGTLMAAGIQVEDLERSTRVRESKLNSEMDLARERQEQLRYRTEDDVRSLEEEIRRVRETCDTGIAEEEQRISRAADGIEEIKRVRAFFSFPNPEDEQEAPDPVEDPPVDETQVFEPFDADETRVLRRRGGTFGAAGDDADTPSEGPSPYRDPHGPPDGR